jgi:hypothetical protein
MPNELPLMSTPPPSAPPRAPVSAAQDCRCTCGSLLARWVPGGVELKCRRCKRTLQLPVEGLPVARAARGVPVGP